MPLGQGSNQNNAGSIIEASDGVDGSAAPTLTSQIGGKDGSGNLQTLLTDTSGALITSGRVPLTGSSPTFSTVGVTSAQVVASNANRHGLVLTNTSNNRISLGFGAAAVLNSGVTLYPGGIYVMDAYTFNTGAVNAIASVASSNMSVQEFT